VTVAGSGESPGVGPVGITHRSTSGANAFPAAPTNVPEIHPRAIIRSTTPLAPASATVGTETP
jgi:hypothetical protein